jgi:hypothetical protein
LILASSGHHQCHLCELLLAPCFENIFSIARGRDLIHECKHDTNSFDGTQIHLAGDKKRQIHFAGDKKRQIHLAGEKKKKNHFAGDKFISRETNSYRGRQIHFAGVSKRQKTLLCILSPFKCSVVDPTAILSFIRERK